VTYEGEDLEAVKANFEEYIKKIEEQASWLVFKD